MKTSTPCSTLSRRARGLACAVLAAALSLLALCALYAPLVRSHGPAASSDQLAKAAVRNLSLPYPFDCVL
ncbi:MAG: hypothetical protein II839_04845 [Kiritimatiellae bacterium]|nr:hypothetical protein [Kiritimatiellia bacterium]